MLAGISFTPREVGDYLVNVYRHGQHIPNSPFKIYVGETEIGNAGRVKVYGKGLSHGMANELNEFFVNTKDAGNLFLIRFVYISVIIYFILQRSPLATVVDISAWVPYGIPPVLPVSGIVGATRLPRFTWKVAVKTVCVHMRMRVYFYFL